MSNEITTEVITKSKLENYLQIAGVAQNLTADEQKNFLQIAMDFNLNPFKREIYCTSYGQGEFKKTSIIIGYEVYIKRAERTNQLDGWQVVTNGSVKNNDLKATITIYRKDRKFPFIHEVDYSEYVQTTYDKKTDKLRPNKMWNEKPITMLKKVATAQGFRLCFSDELGGMPYDSSELPEEEKEVNSITPLAQPQPQKTIEEKQVETPKPANHTETEQEYLERTAEEQQEQENQIDVTDLIGKAPTKEDSDLYWKDKTGHKEFFEKYPTLELFRLDTGKYVFQPRGTYAATKKAS